MNPIPVSLLVPPEEIHRVTIEEYHGLVNSGALDDAHVELIDGLIVDMSPRSPQHENAVEWLNRWLISRLDERFRVRAAGSMTFDTSEPEPDIAVAHGRPSALSHPQAAYLVIEVAWSSHNRDLNTKPAIYAPTVLEYWVVDLEQHVVITHRNYDGKAYRDVTIHPRGAKLAPVAVPTGELDTDELFAYALAER